MATQELISQADYARRRGVSEAAVSKAIRRCRIPLIDGKIDPLVADTLWKARTDPDQQARALAQNRRTPANAALAGDPPAPASPSSDQWRQRREAAEAQLAEINLKRAAGTLVDRAEVERELGRRLEEQRVQFDALPDRAAAALGVNDEHRRKVRQFLRDEIAKILLEVVNLGAPEAA